MCSFFIIPPSCQPHYHKLSIILFFCSQLFSFSLCTDPLFTFLSFQWIESSVLCVWTASQRSTATSSSTITTTQRWKRDAENQIDWCWFAGEGVWETGGIKRRRSGRGEKEQETAERAEDRTTKTVLVESRGFAANQRLLLQIPKSLLEKNTLKKSCHTSLHLYRHFLLL